MRQIEKIKILLPLIAVLFTTMGVMSCSKSSEEEVESTEECNQRIYDLNVEMTMAAQAYGENRTEANCNAVKQAAQAVIAYAATAPCVDLRGDEEVFELAELDCPEN